MNRDRPYTDDGCEVCGRATRLTPGSFLWTIMELFRRVFVYDMDANHSIRKLKEKNQWQIHPGVDCGGHAETVSLPVYVEAFLNSLGSELSGFAWRS